MRIAATVARCLLGFIFTVFGLNGFLHFLPAGPMPPLAAHFAGAMVQSGYMTVVFGLELFCGLLFLANRYVSLALTMIAPVIVNILLFHILMAPTGLPLAVIVALLWMALAYRMRSIFAGIFQQSSEPKLA